MLCITAARPFRWLLSRAAGRALDCGLMLVLLLLGSFSVGARAGEIGYGIAMHGAPAMPENFARLPYADPTAPKGGRFVQGVLGTFDSLNPFIVKGIAPPSMRGYVVV